MRPAYKQHVREFVKGGRATFGHHSLNEGLCLKNTRNRPSGDPNCELFPQGPIIPVPPSSSPYRPVGICGNNWAVSPYRDTKRKPPNQRVRGLLFPLFRWWLCSMAMPKQHQAVLGSTKTRVQKPVSAIPIGISASARDCLSMLCLEHGRHRIEELPHMVGGVRRMKQPVRHETAPIGRNGLGNLSGVRSMRYTFSSCAFTTIDFRGFDSSAGTARFGRATRRRTRTSERIDTAGAQGYITAA